MSPRAALPAGPPAPPSAAGRPGAARRPRPGAPPLPGLVDRAEVLVAGEWRPAGGEEEHAVVDPATQDVVAVVRGASAADVDAAVRAAAAAQPAWAALPVEARCDVVEALADALAARADDLGALVSVEVGVPLREAVAVQVGLPVAVARATAALGREHAPPDRVDGALVLRDPVGVVAALTPWNFPLHQITAKLAPALVAGCAVVLKPSEAAPLDAHVLAQAAVDAGVPPGVLGLVHGGPAVGDALVGHERTDAVSFTGSVAVGVAVAQRAAQRVRRTTLELGGKSPNVVLDDVDVAACAPTWVRQAFSNNGQACNALTRLVVPRALLPDVREHVVAATQALVVGDPFEPGTDLGPLASRRGRDRTLGVVERAVDAGARLLCGGGVPDGRERGWYVRPAVLDRVHPAAEVAQEEVFGPVLVLQPYDDLDEAVRLADGTPYGLTAGVWSADRERAGAVAARLHVGQVKINGARTRDALLAPFGGYGLSGSGRELGRFGLEEFLEVKAVLG